MHGDSVELDDVRRLRVLAEAEGHRMQVERVLPLPFDTVWSVAGDLEAELPQLVRGLLSFRINGASADQRRLTATATSLLGHQQAFDVVLRPGWCLLRSPTVVGCMAAVPEGESVRFAFFGGLRMSTLQSVRRLFGETSASRGRRLMDRFERRVRLRDATAGPWPGP